MLTVRFEKLGLKPGAFLLDVGCGGGRHSFEALKRGICVAAVDLDELALKGVSYMFRALYLEGELPPASAAFALRADALFLPFKSGSFDAVIASEVLEHVREDRSALAELARVLKEGGVLAVTVPRFYPELINWALSDEYYMREGGHVRIYRKGVLKERLVKAGLKPFFEHHAHGMHSPYWWLKCLVGVQREDHPLVALYKRLLEYDIMHPNLLGKALERITAPIMGKSYVIYARKVVSGAQ